MNQLYTSVFVAYLAIAFCACGDRPNVQDQDAQDSTESSENQSDWYPLFDRLFHRYQ